MSFEPLRPGEGPVVVVGGGIVGLSCAWFLRAAGADRGVAQHRELYHSFNEMVKSVQALLSHTAAEPTITRARAGCPAISFVKAPETDDVLRWLQVPQRQRRGRDGGGVMELS